MPPANSQGRRPGVDARVLDEQPRPSLSQDEEEQCLRVARSELKKRIRENRQEVLLESKRIRLSNSKWLFTNSVPQVPVAPE